MYVNLIGTVQYKHLYIRGMVGVSNKLLECQIHAYRTGPLLGHNAIICGRRLLEMDRCEPVNYNVFQISESCFLIIIF